MTALAITRLGLRDFRNFARLDVEPDRALTVLIGPNAAGKTNIVEALQLVTAATSLRTPVWSDVIRWGTSAAHVFLEAASEAEGRRTVELRIDQGGRRNYRVNECPARRVADVRGALPAVVFSPDDLRMVKDSAERRRAALDEVGVQLSTPYAALKADFERALRQRNALLRADIVDEEQLKIWTDRFADTGSRFAGHRIRLFRRVAGHVAHTYPNIASGEELTVRYVSAWFDPLGDEEDTRIDALREQLSGALTDRRSEELSRRTTAAGPHRDDIAFEIGGRDARTFASQGEQRTVALAWKLAEVATVEEVGDREPVLLLDDVMSELDGERRERLTEVVRTSAQTFITTTNKGYFSDSLLGSAKVIELP